MKVIKIGRSSSNDVNINDPTVSHAHCQIIQDDNGQYRLIDTNSKNGTYVNGIKRHGEVYLNTYDVIRIGNTTLPWLSYFNGMGGDMGGTEIDPGYRQPIPPQPDNFLVWSILATIFCCLPFGIVAIVKSSRVDGLWRAGDYNGAIEAARSARTWFWWSFGIGLAFEIIYLIYYLIVVAAIGLSL